MKKTIAILLTILMVFALTACWGNNAGTNTGTAESDKTAAADNTAINSGINYDTDKDTAEPDTKSSQTEDNSSGTVKILVAYFSATNTTKGVAETVADILSADLYEIIPEQPYTDADLNYHDDNSRTSIEMNDPNSRPTISESVQNIEQYDIVFIGYPIWWGDAPRILSTFMESYNFSNKTIVPFCTSGGSGIGSSAKNLELLTSDATWLSGRRFQGNASQSTIAEWINSLELNITAQ